MTILENKPLHITKAYQALLPLNRKAVDYVKYFLKINISILDLPERIGQQINRKRGGSGPKLNPKKGSETCEA